MTSQDISRFLLAQARNHADAEREIATGRKVTHWMWYVFPQIHGLGSSNFARLYGIQGLEEAADYLAHPVLGPRLQRMCTLILTHADTPPQDILGQVDALKLRSCVTLFSMVPGAPPVFRQVLDSFYDGRPCPKTKALLAH